MDGIPPQEKIHRMGPESMRDEELLALVWRVARNGSCLETAEAVLQRADLACLAGMSGEQMQKEARISRARAGVLLACFELSRRALRQGVGILPYITRPNDAVPMLTDVKDEPREHFVALYLNARNQVMCRETVSIGTLNASLVHPREVFAPAVAARAAGLILAHNHPSGDVTPSKEDINLTRRLMQAGEIMGIDVLDHLILSAERFLSMREANLL